MFVVCPILVRVFNIRQPLAVIAGSKAWVCGRCLGGTAGSNSTGGHGCLSVVNVVCCQVEVCATG